MEIRPWWSFCFLVSGCMTKPLQMGASPHPFDGKWQGLMRLSIGTQDCIEAVGDSCNGAKWQNHWPRFVK